MVNIEKHQYISKIRNQSESEWKAFATKIELPSLNPSGRWALFMNILCKAPVKFLFISEDLRSHSVLRHPSRPLPSLLDTIRWQILSLNRK